MNRDRLKSFSAVQIAVVGMLVSVMCSLAVYLFTRRMSQGNNVPVQPATDRPVTTTAQPHFTEDIVIPGITETGEQIEHDDDTRGRSPGGV